MPARTLIALAVICLVAAGALLTGGGEATSATKIRKTSGTAWVARTHVYKGSQYVSGDFRDRILGEGGIVFQTDIRPAGDRTLKIHARNLTLYTKKGTMTGVAEATLTVTGTEARATDGAFALSHGTGAYKGHIMTGVFAGESTFGVYAFKFTGTYK